MHGTEDDIVPLGNGLAIHEACKNPVEPLWLEGYGHNDLPNAPGTLGKRPGVEMDNMMYFIIGPPGKDADLKIWVGGDCKR